MAYYKVEHKIFKEEELELLNKFIGLFNGVENNSVVKNYTKVFDIIKNCLTNTIESKHTVDGYDLDSLQKKCALDMTMVFLETFYKEDFKITETSHDNLEPIYESLIDILIASKMYEISDEVFNLVQPTLQDIWEEETHKLNY